jgi:hypothetical protein
VERKRRPTQNSCPQTPTIVRSLSAIKQITHLSLFSSPSSPPPRGGTGVGSSGLSLTSPSQSIFFLPCATLSAWVVGNGGHVRGGEINACSSRKPSASSTNYQLFSIKDTERRRGYSRNQSRIFGIRTISLTCYLGDVEGSQLIS